MSGGTRASQALFDFKGLAPKTPLHMLLTVEVACWDVGPYNFFKR